MGNQEFEEGDHPLKWKAVKVCELFVVKGAREIQSETYTYKLCGCRHEFFGT
jgi:hypothetical protein